MDANDLYGSAMSEYLQPGGFKIMEEGWWYRSSKVHRRKQKGIDIGGWSRISTRAAWPSLWLSARCWKRSKFKKKYYHSIARG